MPKTLTGFPLDRGESDLTLVIERLKDMNNIYEKHIKKLNKEIEELKYRSKDSKEIDEKHQKQMGELIEENKKLKEQLNESK